MYKLCFFGFERMFPELPLRGDKIIYPIMLKNKRMDILVFKLDKNTKDSKLPTYYFDSYIFGNNKTLTLKIETLIKKFYRTKK